MHRDRLDAFGAISLLLFTALLGFGQVIIAVVNEGLQPVFFAGLRSGGAAVLIGLWAWYRGIPLAMPRATLPWALLVGAVFGFEFLALFVALDLTTVARSSIIFYSMPVWAALGAHFLLRGEAMTRRKAAGLLLAFLGVAWALAHRPPSGTGSIVGDLAALAGALGWAAQALLLRASPVVRLRPESQLFWQVAISAILLLGCAPLFGPLVRDLQPIHLWGLAFQIVVVVSLGFLLWLWLLARYPATSVVSFSFLGPLFGAFFGWLVLGERLTVALVAALALVAVGLWLINRPAKTQVPQKV